MLIAARAAQPSAYQGDCESSPSQSQVPIVPQPQLAVASPANPYRVSTKNNIAEGGPINGLGPAHGGIGGDIVELSKAAWSLCWVQISGRKAASS
ncbi:hypothetical protein PG996_008836 [Apiospora saccharicola]|uniref:Uncharacterized protein n=1 Tax=Apiospora saccharicola TaxID=335842 RepID=A0ABR1UZ15_9PEZI